MPLTEDTSVALKPLWLAGSNVKHVVVEDTQDLNEGKRRSDVTSSAANECVNDRLAKGDRSRVEPGYTFQPTSRKDPASLRLGTLRTTKGICSIFGDVGIDLRQV